MAKLSANGTEVARFVRRRERNDGYVLRDVTEISVRSNEKVLRKHTAAIVDVYTPKGYRLVSRGWKQWGEKLPNPRLDTFTAFLARAGFTKMEKSK